MPKAHPIKDNFNGGEASPLLEGRVTLEKYNKMNAVTENFLLWPHGPATRRPGTIFIAETKDSSKESRLIRFEFSVTQAYILEFGDLYIRFYRDQARIENPPGTPVEIASPYTEAQLSGIKFTGSADVLYLVHPDHAPRKLSRLSDTSWTLTTINFRPPPTSEQNLVPASGTLTLSALTGSGVTATAASAAFLNGDIDRQIISGGGRGIIVGFTSSTVVTIDIIDDFAASPIAEGVWSLGGSPFGGLTPDKFEPKGAQVTLTSTGEIESRTSLVINGNTDWTVSPATAGEYYINNAAPFYSASKPDRVYIDDVLIVEGTVGSLGIIQWDFGDNDALGYNTIYIRLAGSTDPDSEANGFVESSTVIVGADLFRSDDVGKYVTSFNGGYVRIDQFISATEVKGEILKVLIDATESTSWILEDVVWSATNGYPVDVYFHEDRLGFAGSFAFPQSFWLSVTGDYENFTPGADDGDSIQQTLSGREINTILWVESADYLIIGTSGGIWRIYSSDVDNIPLTQANINARKRSNIGSFNLVPEIIDNEIIFLQKAGQKVLSYRSDQSSLSIDAAPTIDITLFAEHITSGGVVDMFYQREPMSTLWAVRADGELLGLTYLPGQEVVGWHRHPTGLSGLVESGASIPGTLADEAWLIVNRTVDGSIKRFVELTDSLFDDTSTDSAFFLDCGVKYNGVATDTITGLDHLEGETVSVLADGYEHPDRTVSSGEITLERAASQVAVGINYNSIIQTMRLEAGAADGTAQTKIKKITSYSVRFLETLGGIVGPDTDIDEKRRIPYRDFGDAMDSAIPLFTGDIVDQPYDSDYERDGKIAIIQDKPLPMTVIAIVPNMETEDN